MLPNEKLENVLRSVPEELKGHYRSILESSEGEEEPEPEFFTDAELREQTLNEPAVTVMPTGLPNLDQITKGGIAHGETVLLAARSGVGKTHFAVSLSVGMASMGKRIFYLTLEDGWRMILARLKQMDPQGLSAEQIFMVREDQVTLKNAAAVLKRATEDADLIVIDNLFAMPLRQGSKTDYWTSQAEWVDDVASMVRSSDCGCLILHHLNKSKDAETEGYQVAGSTRIVNRVGQLWLLGRSEDNYRELMVKVDKHRRTGERGECSLISRPDGRLIPTNWPGK